MAQNDKFGRQVQNYKGTRDYSGKEAKKRAFVIQQITDVFEMFGFEALETPAIELDRILDGKYGDEGERNRFKLSVNSTRPDSQAGLRYDHTVPLARYMAMNQSTNILPYRRYAIGKVWRYESVQAGRLREFTQCDFDTVGSNSLIVDAEIMAINYNVLRRLGFANTFAIQYNDRRLLDSMTRLLGANKDESVEILRAWDKLEKVGVDGSSSELLAKNLNKDIVAKFISFTNSLLSSNDQFNYLRSILPESDQWTLNIIQNIFLYATSMGVPTEVIEFNPLLARGLDYYTGPIFETVVRKSGIGSIGGGGRFDNLIATLGGPDMPASGSSFGLERVLSVMDQMGIQIPDNVSAPVFVSVFDPTNLDLVQRSFQIASEIRLDGIPVEVYTGNQSKLGKQIDIANRKGSAIFVIIGENELTRNEVTLKVLKTGKQQTIRQSDLRKVVRQILS